jgi:hypothetical protein
MPPWRAPTLRVLPDSARQAHHIRASGPTRSFCRIIAYVGCLRTSGLDLLAARLSESDPKSTTAAKGAFVHIDALKDIMLPRTRQALGHIRHAAAVICLIAAGLEVHAKYIGPTFGPRKRHRFV